MKNNADNKRLESLFLKAAAQQSLNTIAIHEWDGQQWQKITFDSLEQQAEKFAAELQSHQIKSGERVTVITHNRIQAVVALFGIWLAKATVVLIDPDLPESSLLDQIQIADARFCVAEKEILSMHINKINAEYIIAIDDDQLAWQKKEIIVSKTIDADCSPEIAAIIFTSGTTGDYKGVMLTHSNFMYLTQFYKNLSPQDGCSLTVLPLSHVAGLFCGFLQPLFLGVRIVIFREFSVEALQHAFLHYRPTLIISVPRLLEVLDQKIKSSIDERGIFTTIIFTILLKTAHFFGQYLRINMGKLFFKSVHQKFGGRLKKILCGSAHLSPPIQKRFLSMGFEVLLSYGLTETCGPITLTEVKHRWRLGNVGPCVEKNDLKINTDGEIIYRGAALMSGYFRDKKVTEETVRNGFFHTRDLGRLDQYGNLFIAGRIKELIIFADGKKAMPEQIEKQYVGIAHIKEFTVFGVENNNTAMAVLAFIPADNSNSTETTQKIFQRACELKSPYRISDVLIVNTIPRSNTLKIKRHTLAKQFYEEKNQKKNVLHAQADQNDLIQAIIACFQSTLPDKKVFITADITFAELDIDSLLAAQLCEKINTQLGFSLQPTVFWFSHTIRELNHYLLFEKQKMHSFAPTKNTSDAIAIIALDCVFPGAPDYDTFWKNGVAGKDAITEIPLSRWNNADYYDPYPLAPGKTNSRHGGFIDLPIDFPCKNFGIKPRIAAMMDPTQKIILMATQRLLKNNSCTKTGFFIGAGFPDFMIQSVKNSPLEKTNPYSGVGMSDFSLSARAAYHFDLDGPAMVVKTACSSALTAVHLAIRALQVGDCDSAIAGGINLLLVPDISVCLTKGGFLSPDGRCKSFDADANGYVRSEGCGLVLLKRYDDAVKNGDNILSVILGSAMNQDGASNGITAPSGKAQMACYEAALKNARLSPEQIDFIEAHGSGTQLGDAIEMQSIQQVYDIDRNHHPLTVGAVKSSIGHCESAAGIAGLIKAIGVLQHQYIPPNLHYHKPNPHISFEKSNVRLPHKAMPFEKHCDYAAISSFGVAGTNVHMIVGKIAL